jgi:hypothetical protein
LSRDCLEDRAKWILVEHDYCSKEDAITESEAIKRLNFLKLPTTPDNIKDTMSEIDFHRTKFKNITKGNCERFLVDVATDLKITYDDEKKPVTTWNEIQIAFKQCRNKRSMIQFKKLVYNSWEFVSDYRGKLTRTGLREMGILVVYRGFDGWVTTRVHKREQPRCCFEKLTSICLQFYRNSLNDIGKIVTVSKSP